MKMPKRPSLNASSRSQEIYERKLKAYADWKNERTRRKEVKDKILSKIKY